MTNNEFNGDFDFSGLKDFVSEEQMTELWAKAEVAKIMMKHAIQLFEQIKNDVDFYVMTARYED